MQVKLINPLDEMSLICHADNSSERSERKKKKQNKTKQKNIRFSNKFYSFQLFAIHFSVKFGVHLQFATCLVYRVPGLGVPNTGYKWGGIGRTKK